MLVAKHLIFNGQSKEIYGEVVRRATPEDKAACKIGDSEIYLVVDFTYDQTNYRGLWRQSECLIAF